MGLKTNKVIQIFVCGYILSVILSNVFTQNLDEQVIKNFTAYQTKSGRKLWDLTAKQANIYKDNNLVKLKDIFIKFYDTKKKIKFVISTLKAQEGKINTDTNDFYTIGYTTVTNYDNEILYCFDLKYISSEDKIFTESNIKLIKEDTIITGEDLEASIDLKKILIKKNKIEIKNDTPKIYADKVEIEKDKKITLFEKNVKYTEQDLTILCDKLIKYDIENIIYSEGNIKLYSVTKSSEKIEINCDYSKYYKQDNKIELWTDKDNKVYVLHTDTNNFETEVFSDKILVNRNERKIYFDSVFLKQKNNSILAQSGIFNENLREISLDKGKMQYNTDNYILTFRAEKITLFLDTEKIILQDSVKGFLNL